MKKAYRAISTVFGIGRVPAAPGTAGSLAGLFLCLILHGYPVVYVGVFIFLFTAGVISSGRMEEDTGEKDPQSVVIDEFACIFLVYFLVPINVLTIITGFILYRLIDIFKIPPMRSLEKLKGGWGIMLDDLAAGVYVNVILQAITHLKIF